MAMTFLFAVAVLLLGHDEELCREQRADVVVVETAREGVVGHRSYLPARHHAKAATRPLRSQQLKSE
jgi:hypothetical protein